MVHMSSVYDLVICLIGRILAGDMISGKVKLHNQLGNQISSITLEILEINKSVLKC